MRALDHLNLPCGIPYDVMFDHMRNAMEKNFPPLMAEKQHDGTLFIVGNGPSLVSQLPKLKARRKRGVVITVQGADGVLIRNGIIPDYVAVMDGADFVADMITPHPSVHYLVCSTVHDSVYARLDGCKVSTWHADNNRDEAAFLEREYSDRPFIVVAGGCSVGLRCFNIGYVMGFRRFQTFGMDASIAQDGSTHSDNRIGQDGPKRYEVECAGRKFTVTNIFAHQAQDFVKLMRETFPGKIDVIAHGDGLIQHICRTMRRNGECKRHG